MEKIQHLLNLEKQRFIALGGLPGVGKSTLSKPFIEAGYEIVSPDIERFELAKKEHGEDKYESQLQHVLEDYSSEAWKRCEQKVFDFLKEGKSVIFDATLTTPKARRKIKAWSEKSRKELSAIYIDVPLKTAIERNDKRGRTLITTEGGEPVFGRKVPDFVIEDKFVNQALPTKEEGFEEIIVISQMLEDRSHYHIESIIDSLIKNVRETIDMLKQSDMLKNIFPYLDACWGVTQDNKHHTQTLEEHMIKAAEIIVETYKDEVDIEELKVLVLTMLNHDIGKKDTKEFYGIMLEDYEDLEKNEKVIVKGQNEFGVIIQKQLFKGFYQSIVPHYVIKHDPNAHFYGHENVGAIYIRRNLLELGLDEEFVYKVSTLILHHMRLPYQKTSNKSMNKFIRTVGKENVENLLRVRYADKKSSGTQVGFDKHFKEIKAQLQELLTKQDNVRISKLPIGSIITFDSGAHTEISATVEKIENNEMHLKDVIYKDNQYFESELILPIKLVRNIKIKK